MPGAHSPDVGTGAGNELILYSGCCNRYASSNGTPAVCNKPFTEIEPSILRTLLSSTLVLWNLVRAFARAGVEWQGPVQF